MITIDSDAGSFPAYRAEPDGEARGGLIVIHEVWGLVEHTRDVADRFAAEGYVVVAPDLLSDHGITEEVTAGLGDALFDPERRNEVQPTLRKLMAPLRNPGFSESTVQRLRACVDLLFDQDAVNGRVGVTGFCFGGTYSFSLAVQEPRLKAAVPFYGHADFDVTELRRIAAPVLAFYGENDENLMKSLPDLTTKMAEAGVDFTAQVYPDAGHAFFNDTNPFAYNEKAARDAWARTLAFLAEHVR